MTRMNLKRLSLLMLLSFPLRLVAAEDLPKPFSFARYQGMMDRSPFAVATAVTAPTAPNFAKDLYVANAARDKEGDFVTIASSTDRNFKKYLTTNTPVDGYSIASIEWSDKVGATKVTIAKDGQTATLTFNEALLRGPPGPGQNAAALGKEPQPPQQVQAPAVVPGGPQNTMKQAPAVVPGTQQDAAARPVGPGGAQQNTNKPMPVPMLTTPPPRVRDIIPRNPPGKNAVPPPQAKN